MNSLLFELRFTIQLYCNVIAQVSIRLVLDWSPLVLFLNLPPGYLQYCCNGSNHSRDIVFYRVNTHSKIEQRSLSIAYSSLLGVWQNSNLKQKGIIFFEKILFEYYLLCFRWYPIFWCPIFLGALFSWCFYFSSIF